MSLLVGPTGQPLPPSDEELEQMRSRIDDNNLTPLPPHVAHLAAELQKNMEASIPGSKTLFFGILGTNLVWGFDPNMPDEPLAKKGAVISDGRGSQVLLTIDNLKALVRLIEEGQ